MYEKKALYLGLDPSRYKDQGNIYHLPMIEIVARSINSHEIREAFEGLPFYTHIIFTSRNAARIFVETQNTLMKRDINKNYITIAVGKATASLLIKMGLAPQLTAKNETAEGIIQVLSQLDLSNAFCFWPHSAISRPVITDFFLKQKIRFTDCALYDTLPRRHENLPDLNDFKEIIFTSPSTVDAFLQFFPGIPEDIKITSIGPVTEKYLSTIKARRRKKA